ncbi:processing peptidase [Gregarina niphandrodes]|uniref:Processing peptidase n=1 Tax=Gregarina niphandrodes TaxID=110365 RepID=A0A023B338_GRENI|nr:processing peptidase [Gregarina niphandrodes]EZG55338.1 processing peptidase [Gregarina niphandrodes]|eukprot:XP_011131633.1 processing peptidase [Gregarina niphandrodes]
MLKSWFLSPKGQLGPGLAHAMYRRHRSDAVPGHTPALGAGGRVREGGWTIKGGSMPNGSPMSNGGLDEKRWFSKVLDGAKLDQARAVPGKREISLKIFDPYVDQYPKAYSPHGSHPPGTGSMAPPKYRKYEVLMSEDYPAHEIHKCANGATVIISPNKSDNVSVGVWMNFGSNTGRTEDEGAVHFLEHVLFKGTYNRRQEDIENWIENKGARLDAYTTKEFVGYFGECLKDDAADLLSLIIDMLTNSILDNKVIDKERYTILRELEEVEKIPEEVLLDCIYDQCYSSGSSLGQTILGSRKSICEITAAGLRSILKRFYTPPNLVVTITGNVDVDRILPIVASLAPSSYAPITSRSSEFQADCPKERIYVHLSPDPHLREPLMYLAKSAPCPSWQTESYVLTALSRMLLQEHLLSQEDDNQDGIPVPNVQVPSSLPKAIRASVDQCFDACHRTGGMMGTYRLEHLEASQLKNIREWIQRKRLEVNENVAAAIESMDELDLEATKSELCNTAPAQTRLGGQTRGGLALEGGGHFDYG